MFRGVVPHLRVHWAMTVVETFYIRLQEIP